jgi:Cu/Zn superoxide dismutase
VWSVFKQNHAICNSPEWESTMTKAKSLAGAMILCAILGASASAETVKLAADLKGSNEVPPNTSAGSGKAEATYDTDSKVLTYTVTYTNLSGPAVGAHFHGPGEAGKNAGIVLPFKSAQSPIQGTATLTDTQAADLLAGKWYANIHTAANPGGELRGQMIK